MLVTAGPDGFVATSNVADYPLHAPLTEHLNERQVVGGSPSSHPLWAAWARSVEAERLDPVGPHL